LKEAGFWGKFVLDKDTVCYRTQVALRLFCMPSNKWEHLVASGLGDEDMHQLTVDKILLQALSFYLDTVDQKLGQVDALGREFNSQKETLSRRWKQIRLLLTASMSRMESQS
jgi:hypothetical protein